MPFSVYSFPFSVKKLRLLMCYIDSVFNLKETLA